MGFAGIANIGGNNHPLASTLYGVCTTASATAAKVVDCPDFDTLLTGVSIAVKFLYTNTAANPTLNVNGTGALPIYTDGTYAPGVTPQDSWAANSVVTFTYDGNAWLMTDTMGTALSSFATAFRTELMAQVLETVYPVGSLYMSANATSPATLFGGTWEQIKDRFLLSAGDTYANGSQGGAASVTLTAAQSGLPSHNHSQNAHRHTLVDWNGAAVGGNVAHKQAASIAISRVQTVSSGGRFAPVGVTDGDIIWGNGITANATATNIANSAASASQAHENMPPYLAVYVWKRTA